MSSHDAPRSPAGDAYLSRLQRLTQLPDELGSDPVGDEVREHVADLEALPSLDAHTLAAWLDDYPARGYVLGLAVGLSQEKQKNLLSAAFGTASWRVAVDAAGAIGVINWLDSEFGLLTVLAVNARKMYGYGDVLAARATSRRVAQGAGAAGKLIEDQVEAIVRSFGLPYEMRGRFQGRNGMTGPADLAVPSFDAAKVTVACKGFDSTGSKLTAAVTEIQEMAQVRFAHQYVFAIVDGIGWANRQGDFRRMFRLFEDGLIDGIYTLNDLGQFEVDLQDAARRAKLMP